MERVHRIIPDRGMERDPDVNDCYSSTSSVDTKGLLLSTLPRPSKPAVSPSTHHRPVLF